MCRQGRPGPRGLRPFHDGRIAQRRGGGWQAPGIVVGHQAVLIAPEVPWPPRCGNALRDLQQIHVLEQIGYRPHVVALGRRWDLSAAEEDAAVAGSGCAVTYVAADRLGPRESVLGKTFRKVGYLVGPPRHPFAWWVPAGQVVEAIRGVRANGCIAAVILRSIFVHEIPAIQRMVTAPLVVDCHDADSHLARELLSTVRGLRRVGPWANLVGVRRAMARFLPLATEVWAVSGEDMARLCAEVPLARIVVVPSGMDGRRAATVGTPGEDGLAVLVANFGYAPNARGAEWLLREVWPRVRTRVPSAILGVVGGRLPVALEALARETPGVRIHGLVADLDPLYARAGVVLAPVLEGGGTRLKIVDAWSHGKAAVATSKAVEGLPLAEGIAAVADDAERFATRTADLLTNTTRRRAMGEAALQHFRKTLSWDTAVDAVSTRSVLARPARPHSLQGSS